MAEGDFFDLLDDRDKLGLIPSSGKEIEFDELDRSRGGLCLDGEGNVLFYYWENGKTNYRSEYWPPQRLETAGFITIVQHRWQVKDPRNSYSEEEYSEALDQYYGPNSPLAKRGRHVEKSLSPSSPQELVHTPSHQQNGLIFGKPPTGQTGASQLFNRTGSVGWGTPSSGSHFEASRRSGPSVSSYTQTGCTLNTSISSPHVANMHPRHAAATQKPYGLSQSAPFNKGIPGISQHPQPKYASAGGIRLPSGQASALGSNFHDQVFKRKRQPKECKPVGPPLQSLEIVIICLQDSSASQAVTNRYELLRLLQGGMGEKKVRIPAGSDAKQVEEIIVSTFPALKEAYNKGKEGFDLRTSLGRSNELKSLKGTSGSVDYTRLKRCTSRLYLVPLFDLESVNTDEERANAPQKNCPFCLDNFPNYEFVTHVRGCRGDEDSDMLSDEN